MLIKINSYILFAMLSILVLPAFANLSQTQETIQNKHFKSIACDDSGVHCLGLSHNPKKKILIDALSNR